MTDGVRSAPDDSGGAAADLRRLADRVAGTLATRRRAALAALDTWTGPAADAFRDDLTADEVLAAAAGEALEAAAAGVVEPVPPVPDGDAGPGAGGWR